MNTKSNKGQAGPSLKTTEMTEAALRHQIRMIGRIGIKRKELIQELKPYIRGVNWHTVQNYFTNSQKMNPEKRLIIEGAVDAIIKARS